MCRTAFYQMPFQKHEEVMLLCIFLSVNFQEIVVEKQPGQDIKSFMVSTTVISSTAWWNTWILVPS